jgi:bifunctional UDP-N-acetylglucosamine pyrophosphorylase / glucosamine-1-phosphate N-acetyltransferase
MAGRALAVLVLAAGEGTRMRSALPKVLHEAAGRPLLGHVLAAVRALRPERVLVVVGHGGEAVRARFADAGVDFVEQSRPRGTGDALLSAGGALRDFRGSLLVLYGDQPLVAAPTLEALVGEQRRLGGAVMLSYAVDEPFGLGRVVRGASDEVLRVVEEKDASAEERAITEVYPGAICFDEAVFELARELSDDNVAGEYYLTDMVELYRRSGRGVHVYRAEDDMRRLIGVNTRAELARAEALLRARTRARWLDAGVTMHAPESTFIDDEVTLARDVVLEPGVLLRGRTRVGEGARVGAYAVLDGCTVAAGARVPSHTHAEGETFPAG